jgi:hypothetical protein
METTLGIGITGRGRFFMAVAVHHPMPAPSPGLTGKERLSFSLPPPAGGRWWRRPHRQELYFCHRRRGTGKRPGAAGAFLPGRAVKAMGERGRVGAASWKGHGQHQRGSGPGAREIYGRCLPPAARWGKIKNISRAALRPGAGWGPLPLSYFILVRAPGWRRALGGISFSRRPLFFPAPTLRAHFIRENI